MLTVRNLEVRAGATLLLADASFSIGPGDKIGLVGRNGAGKTTLTRVLAGLAQPAAGTVQRTGPVGYLPQDARSASLATVARERVLSARHLDSIMNRMHRAGAGMGDPTESGRAAAMTAYARAEAEFVVAGGYAAEAEAARIANSLGLSNRVLDQPLGALSGGQRRRVELARVLFSDASTLLLDEPTNHLDADSILWLHQYLHTYQGGLLVISHDADLLDQTVNKVFHLDPDRSELDLYAMSWTRYQAQVDLDERRRVRERRHAEQKAGQLAAQAARMGAISSKAAAAHHMVRRAERLLSALEDVRRPGRVAQIRFPEPAACGRTPLAAQGLSKSYGTLEVFRSVDLAIDRGSRVVVLGLNGAGKTTLLKILAGVEAPDEGSVSAGHGLRVGYFAQEQETLDLEGSVLSNMKSAAPELDETGVRHVLGLFLFPGAEVEKSTSVLSGGEKTRLALAMLVTSGANLLLLDEPTNNLDPAARAQVLRALDHYRGAVVLVTHDESAVDALRPDRVLLLPDGVEDYWSPSYRELLSLA